MCLSGLDVNCFNCLDVGLGWVSVPKRGTMSVQDSETHGGSGSNDINNKVPKVNAFKYLFTFLTT